MLFSVNGRPLGSSLDIVVWCTGSIELPTVCVSGVLIEILAPSTNSPHSSSGSLIDLSESQLAQARLLRSEGNTE